jgi:hypothetical protein
MGSVMFLSSQSITSDGVKAHQDEEHDPDAQIDYVSHFADSPFRGGVCASGP